MIGYVLNRIAQAVPVLLLASIAVFLVLRLVPGDPAATLAGSDATQQRVQEIRHQLGVDRPLPLQYVDWLGDLARGNLGTSFSSGLSVGRLLKLSFPPTLELALASYPIALLIGVPFGVLAAVRPRGLFDWLLSGYTVVTLGIPNFLLGVLLLYLFSVKLGWLPSAGQVNILTDPGASLKHLLLPATALGAGLAAGLARYTRSAVMDALGQDYIRTARAKGLAGHTVVLRHALRNALIPIVTIIAIQVGQLLAGTVVIERVYTRPGLGQLIVDAIQKRDYLVVQSSLVILVSIFILVNLCADIAYGFLSPQVRGR